jgi:hypothetical protein
LKFPEEEGSECDSVPKEVDQSERRKAQPVLQINQSSEELLPCKKFSSWRKLIRVTGYLLRFIHRIKNKHRTKENSQKTQTIDTHEVELTSAKELQDAESYWKEQSQSSLHARLRKGELKGLTPFIDKEGIIRVGGRVNKAVISYDAKHPVLLPREHWTSLLITRYYHQIGHSGVGQQLLQKSRKSI